MLLYFVAMALAVIGGILLVAEFLSEGIGAKKVAMLLIIMSAALFVLKWYIAQ